MKLIQRLCTLTGQILRMEMCSALSAALCTEAVKEQVFTLLIQKIMYCHLNQAAAMTILIKRWLDLKYNIYNLQLTT